MGVSENRGVPYFRVLINRILLFRVLYWGPLFPEIPTYTCGLLDRRASNPRGFSRLWSWSSRHVHSRFRSLAVRLASRDLHKAHWPFSGL